ncbi:hypothetical protein [Piscinibacter defluvii]|uniref:hypothetical protein n=1 Tax=Piscinibacter defluvii TaxID=1796922 RepID=UPI000FDF134D|nr:hypothetical protein [Piscinibacter defluvii]
MADVSTTVEAPWDDGAPVAALVEVPWDDATAIGSTGGAWTAPPAPPGGTPTGPNTVADFVIPRQAVYDVAHVVTVIDQRDGLPVELESMSLSCDEASVCWTLSAAGPAALFERLTTGDELPILDITIDGMQWIFVAESVQRSREFAGSGVRITGRSLTILAGEPYQFVQNWVNDGPTTAAQIAEQAQVFTGLELEWQLEDWPVPDRVWTFSGSPLAVVQRVAESVGAVLRSARNANSIAVMPRYRLLPNEWPETAPDVDIHVEAVMTDSFERSDRPAYDGIYVSGQQQGVTCLVRLAGTAGERAAPLVTDLLITDSVAAQQRGVAELGAAGPQAIVRMTLPVLTDAGAPGVLELGWLCRVFDGFSKWWGVVRAITVDVAFPSVMQTVTLERHLGYAEGTSAVEEEEPAAPPAPPAGAAIGWLDLVTDPDGTAAHANSGFAQFVFGFEPIIVNTSMYAGVVGFAGESVSWSPTWTPVNSGDPSPTLTPLSGGRVQVEWANAGGFPPNTYPGLLVLGATVDGGSVATIEVVAADAFYDTFTWGPSP